MKKYLLLPALALVVCSLTSCFVASGLIDAQRTFNEEERQAALAARGPYPVTTGPAGGLVFYDKGAVSDGWRYLEAAPVEYEFTAVWSAGKKVVNTSMDFGYWGDLADYGAGKKNTQEIIKVVSAAGESGTAAQQCAALNINGFKDWHLPSFREAEAMLVNLHRQNKGGFAKSKDAKYLTSSQIDDDTVWYVDFAKGQILWGNKSHTYRVRPVRTF